MTNRNQQMYDDFQLVYNNLASNLAPGLDTFEISMYLTKAYHAFVINNYHQYEKSEAARKTLIELTRDENLSPLNDSSLVGKRICNNSAFFSLPDDILYVVYEALQMDSNAASCFKNKTIQITPVTHDEFHSVYPNPFRYNDNHALRLDIDKEQRLAEIISPAISDLNVSGKYKVRYIKKPGPIILENGITIDGITSETESELNQIYDKDIVRLAAQLAYHDYKAA